MESTHPINNHGRNDKYPPARYYNFDDGNVMTSGSFSYIPKLNVLLEGQQHIEIRERKFYTDIN